MCHVIWPASIFARSSMSLMSRVSRSLSLMMISRNSWRSAVLEIRVVVQDSGEGADRGERGAQLVADGRDKVVLHPVELLQALVRTRSSPVVASSWRDFS